VLALVVSSFGAAAWQDIPGPSIEMRLSSVSEEAHIFGLPADGV
jgi:hypothetical protein